MIGKDIVIYGVAGGANWPGASIDPRTGILYVASSQVPWLIRVGYKDLNSRSRDTSEIEGYSFYQEKCSSCHSISRDGEPYDDIKNNLKFVPSLIGLSFMKEYKDLISKEVFDSLHSFYSINVSQEDLDLTYSYFSELDKKADNEKVMGINGYWRRLIDVDGNPGSKPPWGFLTAIDLNTGTTKWKIPFSKTTLKNGQIVDGEENLGSVITTAGDLIFITGSTDNKIKALNISDGDELWSYTLPQIGSATSMTFEDNGIQYLVITASGMLKDNPSMSQDHILTFKIFNRQNKELGVIPIKTTSSVSTNDLSLFETKSKVGKGLYAMSCASCHDSGAAKAPVVGSISDWADRLSYGKDRLYENSIQGYSGTSGYMPAKGGADYLSDEQVRIAVDYMIELSR